MTLQIRPSEAEFMKLAKKGNVVPVYGEFFADLETPVSAFLKLDDGQFSFLLESVEGAEKLARYSFIGSRPRLIFNNTGRLIEISRLDAKGKAQVERYETQKDPLSEVEALMKRYQFVEAPELPRFCGGLVGSIGYNIVQSIEPVPPHRKNDLKLPDIMMMLADTMAVFDHAQHKLLLVANVLLEKGSARAAYREALAKIEDMASQLRKPLPVVKRRTVKHSKKPPVSSNTKREDFVERVKKAKKHIKAGDIFQVVLSQRFERSIACDAFHIYRSLRSLNPSPYMFFLRFGETSLVGSSPEMLVRCEDGLLENRPIAGTRPRGKTPAEDDRMMQQLVSSPKERAEHVMLVDLGRNDLGRVAKVGSVKIPEFMVVEKYSHVLHMVSSVVAKLKPGRSVYDALRATFPAGTVTGAPKIRAMEIIADLEETDRGPYSGCIGYFGFSGSLDTCITIRTLVVQGDKAYVQAGAGIVADSRPEHEYAETQNKAKGMLRAIEIAEERFVNKRKSP